MITSSFQLSIEKFVSVLTFLDIEDVDSAEVECILANLIHQVQTKSLLFTFLKRFIWNHLQQRSVVATVGCAGRAFPGLAFTKQ